MDSFFAPLCALLRGQSVWLQLGLILTSFAAMNSAVRIALSSATPRPGRPPRLAGGVRRAHSRGRARPAAGGGRAQRPADQRRTFFLPAILRNFGGEISPFRLELRRGAVLFSRFFHPGSGADSYRAGRSELSRSSPPFMPLLLAGLDRGGRQVVVGLPSAGGLERGSVGGQRRTRAAVPAPAPCRALAIAAPPATMAASPPQRPCPARPRRSPDGAARSESVGLAGDGGGTAARLLFGFDPPGAIRGTFARDRLVA